jgi:hypothetical protein
VLPRRPGQRALELVCGLPAPLFAAAMWTGGALDTHSKVVWGVSKAVPLLILFSNFLSQVHIIFIIKRSNLLFKKEGT